MTTIRSSMNMLQSGAALRNPLDSYSSGTRGKIAQTKTALDTLTGLSPLTLSSLSSMGLTSSKISAMTGGVNTLDVASNALVNHGAYSVSNVSQLMNLGSSYSRASSVVEGSATCIMNDLMGLVGGGGNALFDQVESLISKLLGGLLAFLQDVSDRTGLTALLALIDEFLSGSNDASNTINQLIAAELAAAERYAEYLIQYGLAQLFGSWLSSDCQATIAKSITTAGFQSLYDVEI